MIFFVLFCFFAATIKCRKSVFGMFQYLSYCPRELWDTKVSKGDQELPSQQCQTEMTESSSLQQSWGKVCLFNSSGFPMLPRLDPMPRLKQSSQVVVLTLPVYKDFYIYIYIYILLFNIGPLVCNSCPNGTNNVILHLAQAYSFVPCIFLHVDIKHHILFLYWE